MASEARKRPAAKPRRTDKPAADKRATSASSEAAEPVAEAPAPAPPAVPALPPAPAASAAPAAAGALPPGPTPAPARTAASIASYAASNRKPPYPRLSRSAGEQGTVILRVLVQADGSAGAVEIVRSSGYPLLDESARSTVRGWRFNPATVDGKPVAEWYQVPIPFTLHEP